MSDTIDPPGARPPRLSSRIILARAHRWAINQGIPVLATASPGVICTSTAKCEWERDPTAEGVNPLGAAVLMRQHEFQLSPSLDRACFLAVGESDKWVQGFDAGIAGLPPDPKWSTHYATGAMFNSGWMLGRDYFNAAKINAERRAAPELVTCRHHPHVRYEANSGCPRCAREMDEDTKPDNRPEEERAEASDPNHFLTPIVLEKAADSSGNGVHRG